MQTQPQVPVTAEKPLIYGKISQIMSEVGFIKKERKNQQGAGYMFRGIDDLYGALQGLLAKHRVFFTPAVFQREREERTSKSGGTLIYTILTIRFTFWAEDGSFVECVTVGEAMDSGDKSANKAMSAGLKYALLQVFCIPTDEDNDTENQTHQVTPRGTAPGAPTQSVAGQRRPIGPPPGKSAGLATPAPGANRTQATRPTRPGPTAPKTASPSNGLTQSFSAPEQENFEDFPSGPINN